MWASSQIQQGKYLYGECDEKGFCTFVKHKLYYLTTRIVKMVDHIGVLCYESSNLFKFMADFFDHVFKALSAPSHCIWIQRQLIWGPESQQGYLCSQCGWGRNTRIETEPLRAG